MSKERKCKSDKKLYATELDCHESSIAVKQNSWQNSIKIPIILDKQTFTALVDTGSSLSFINSQTLKSLKISVKVNNDAQIRLLDKSLIILNKTVFLNVVCDHKAFTHEFYVFNEMKYEVIIGLDLIRKTGLTIEAEDPITEQKYTLRMPTTIKIPKTSKTLIKFETNHQRPSLTLFTPAPQLFHKYNLIVDKTLINSSKPIQIQITNYTQADKILVQNTVIGYLKNLEKLDFEVNKETDICLFAESKDFDISTLTIKYPNSKLIEILNSFKHLFAEDISQLKRAKDVEHYIDTGDKTIQPSTPYRTSKYEKEIIEEEVKKMLDNKFIVESKSSWASPVVLIPKKDGTIRFAVDYRKLNAISKTDCGPIPIISDTLDALAESKIFTKLDLRSGFWAIGLDERTKEKTAFTTHLGLFQFEVLPFGLQSSPAVFQRYLQKVFSDYLYKFVLIFIDDICIHSKSTEEHINHIKLVFERLDEYNLRLHPKKCDFCTDELTYLGHVITPEGVKPDPEKQLAVEKFPTPRTVRDVRSFLGLSSYYRRFVKSYASIAKPLNQLLKKDQPFVWTKECQIAFETLKNKLISPPIMSHFVPGLDIILYTDACKVAIGAILSQVKDDKEFVVAYISKSLDERQQKYSVCELEALAIVWALQKLRHYLYGVHFVIKTDNIALCYLMKIKNQNGRLARWSLTLQSYDFTIEYKSGKTHTNCDCISRYPYEKADPDIDDFNLLIVEEIDIISEQKSDEWCQELRKGLLEGKNKKYLTNYELKDDVLYRKTHNDFGEKMLLLCVPRKFRRKILTELHSSPISAHLGFVRTYTKLRTRFYWRKIEHSTRQFIKNCKVCQEIKPDPGLPKGSMQPIKYPRHAFEMIGMDVAGPLNPTPRKNKYILVANDYHTKYLILEPVRNIQSETIGKFFINQIVLKYGAVRTVLTDQGRSFVSGFTESVFKLLSSNHVTTTPFHPQTNGLTERAVRTTRYMLSGVIDGKYNS